MFLFSCRLTMYLLWANQFAEEMGVEMVPVEKLVTEEAVRELEYYKKYKSTVNNLFKTR